MRDSEFDKQLHVRLELAEQDKQNAVELAKTKALVEAQKAAATKDTEIQDLKARLDAGGISQKLAVSEALVAVEKERALLAAELTRATQEKQAALLLAESRLSNEVQSLASAKDAEIRDLAGKLETIMAEQRLATYEAVSVVAPRAHSERE